MQLFRKLPPGFIILGLLLVLILVFTAAPAQAQAPGNAQKIIVYFFWGDGCPHCAEAKPYINDLPNRFPNLEVKAYEVWYNDQNRDLLFKMGKAFGFEPTAVPTFFIGDKHWIGYNETVKSEIEAAIRLCVASGCQDAGQGVENPGASSTTQASGVIDLPILGKIDLNAQSLTVSTLLIAFVDGFNPCSVWVLTMLMALTLHTGSRRKVLAIGLIFLTITAAIYALFIAGLFSVLSMMSFVGWIQVAVAMVSLFFALVNIKDYFWFKEGLSFTIADDKKPGIFQRMRKVLESSNTVWGLISATVVLAAGVSLVEFSCTAGFPVLWTNLVSAQKVDGLTFALLLLLYLLIYQLDEIGIFLVAVFTLKASKLEEKQGRILKLIGGMLMLTLAAVMIINPSLMNNLSSALLIFGVAFGLTALVLLLHRKVLPRFGILIGTEYAPKGGRKHNRR